MRLEKRIKRIFNDSKTEVDTFELIKIVRENLFSIKNELKKTMFFLFGFMFVFELSLHTKSEFFKIWVIEIYDIDLIIKLSPLIVSYIYYDLIIMFSLRKLLLQTHSFLMNERILNNNKDLITDIFLPPSSFMMNVLFINNRKQLFQYGGLIGISTTFIPLIFLIYSFYSILIRFKFDLLILIIIMISIFFSFYSILFYYKSIQLLNTGKDE